MHTGTPDSCPPAAPKAPPGPGGSPSPVVASVYADSSTIGLATRPPAMAAVPAGPTDCSDDAARTATAVRRRGKRRAATRQAVASSATAQARVRCVQRIEVRVAGRGPRDREHACVFVSAYDAAPVLRKGALHREQGASRTAGKQTCMLHDISVSEMVNVSSTDQLLPSERWCRQGIEVGQARALSPQPRCDSFTTLSTTLPCSDRWKSVSQLSNGALKGLLCSELGARYVMLR